MSQNEIGKQEQEDQTQVFSFSFFSRWLRSLGDRLDFKMAIKLTSVALLGLYLSYKLNSLITHPNYLIANLWSVITAIIVLQTNIGGTYKAIWLRFIGVIIGSLIGAFFAFALGAGADSIGLAIFVTILLCSLLKIPDSYRLSALSVVVIMLPWKAHPESDPWIFASFRFLDTCVDFWLPFWSHM